MVVETSVDATLFEGDGTTASDQGLFEVGRTKDGVRQRGLLRFDLPEDLPLDAHVECAEIGLHVSRSSLSGGGSDGGGNKFNVGLYRVTTPWSTASHNDVVGGAAKAGDCTWTHASYPDQPWNEVGGDFDAVELSEEAVDADGKHWFGSTRNTRDALQEWMDGTAPNHGFLLMRTENENDEQRTSAAPASTDYTVYSGVDSGHEHMPLLIIKYTAPSKGYPVRDSTYWRSITKYSTWSTDRRKKQHTNNFYFFAGGFGTCLALVGVLFFVRSRSSRSRKNIEIASASQDIEVPAIN